MQVQNDGVSQTHTVFWCFSNTDFRSVGSPAPSPAESLQSTSSLRSSSVPPQVLSHRQQERVRSLSEPSRSAIDVPIEKKWVDVRFGMMMNEVILGAVLMIIESNVSMNLFDSEGWKMVTSKLYKSCKITMNRKKVKEYL